MAPIPQSFRAVAATVGNPQLRNLQLAGVGSMLGLWAYSVALSVYAYHAGGAGAVGLLSFVRWLAAAACAPWFAVFADRVSRRRIMLIANVGRIALLGGMAALAAVDGQALGVYALAVLAACVTTAFQPAQAAFMPALARSPQELASANVVMSSVNSVGIFAGSAFGGILLAVSSAAVVFAVTAAMLAISTLLLSRIPSDPRPEHDESAPIVPAMLGGLRAIRSQRSLQVVLALVGAQTFVAGALSVLLVVVAIRVVAAGNAGVGWLSSALGVGSVIGVAVAALLVGRKRLAGDFGLGLLLWGAPLAVVAAWPNLVVALLLFGVIGIGDTIVDVTSITLMQRSAEDEVLGRVFGVLETVIYGTLALGAVATPGLLRLIGTKPTLIVIGLLLPALAIPALPALRKIDERAKIPTAALDVLRAIPMFAVLPPPALEQLATSAVEVTIPSGSNVFSAGDRGDRFYAIVAGEATVAADGRAPARLGVGDFFGEIALLRDVPRTATVSAGEEPLHLLALERDAFIGAVTGHAPSRETAEAVVSARLGLSAVV